MYLLYDADGGYLSSESGPLTREDHLQSDLSRVAGGRVDDGYVSGGEWALEPSARGGVRYQLRNRRSGRLLGRRGLAEGDGGLALTLVPAEGCATFPELSLDAAGTPTRTTFDDGTLSGIADAHSHLLSNFGFGGGGVFHGGAFHRLGVEHALPSEADFNKVSVASGADGPAVLGGRPPTRWPRGGTDDVVAGDAGQRERGDRV